MADNLGKETKITCMAVSPFKCICPTFLTFRCISYFDTLSLVMGFISSVDELHLCQLAVTIWTYDPICIPHHIIPLS